MNLWRKAAALPDRLLDRLYSPRPPQFFKDQPPSLSALLPYETVLELERPVVLLSDSGMGVIWEIQPIEHEVSGVDKISRQTKIVADIFGKWTDADLFFQLIYDAEPSENFLLPDWVKDPKSAPEKILEDRVRAIQKMAEEAKDSLRLMRRRIFLTARLAGKGSVSAKMSAAGDLEVSASSLKAESSRLLRIASEVEYGLSQAGLAARALSGSEFVSFLRETFHGALERRELAGDGYHRERRLSEQILRDFAVLTPSAVGVGSDSWEVCSWLDQPPVVYPGLWARLLEITTPHRLVVNLRPARQSSDLATKAALLKNASDAFGELQRDEVRLTQDALVRGESLLSVSIHLLVRNCNLSPGSIAAGGAARSVLSKLKTLTQIPWVQEKYAAPALFFLGLPFGYTAAAERYSGRERRVLSRSVAPYLPLFGPFSGTKTPLQLMVSRGGSAVWLNPFDSETSPHMAVLASSGGGKSFFAQNLMMSFFAKNARAQKPPMVFVIDKKTSYEIFARVIGEDFGAQVVKPPESYPNIFRGNLDEYRLPVIIGIIKTAVSLISKGDELGAVDEMLLAEAIKLAFAEAWLDAETQYQDGLLTPIPAGQVRLPRLSNVVDYLPVAAAEAQVAPECARHLIQLLSPLVGSGPYAALFDRQEFEGLEAETPGVLLYDIDAVASNPVIGTLTTQMILSEILRHIRRPENRGRPGLLVLEEAGVLAGSSPQIVAFIQDAWKTFRKLGIGCVGLTNEVDDYARKPGSREIWNISPNKVILRLLTEDLQRARAGVPELGIAPLIESEHLGLLIGSLSKKDGVFSQGLWWSDETQGTFSFHPTGYDYWCAASKPIEVETVYRVKEALGGSFFTAVSRLAHEFPAGIRAADGTLRALTEEDLLRLVKEES